MLLPKMDFGFHSTIRVTYVGSIVMKLREAILHVLSGAGF